MEAFRRRMALRDARAAVARRPPRTLPPSPTQRTVLVLLPHTTEALHAAWEFVARLDLPDRLLIPVQTGPEVGYAPDRFAGAVRHIGPEGRDWRRLPDAKARQSVWTQQPDVAINLAPTSDLGAVLLAGASAAAVRVGLHERHHEFFYDLMVGGETDSAEAIAAVERLLRRLDPPIVPFV